MLRCCWASSLKASRLSSEVARLAIKSQSMASASSFAILALMSSTAFRHIRAEALPCLQSPITAGVRSMIERSRALVARKSNHFGGFGCAGCPARTLTINSSRSLMSDARKAMAAESVTSLAKCCIIKSLVLSLSHWPHIPVLRWLRREHVLLSVTAKWPRFGRR